MRQVAPTNWEWKHKSGELTSKGPKLKHQLQRIFFLHQAKSVIFMADE